MTAPFSAHTLEPLSRPKIIALYVLNGLFFLWFCVFTLVIGAVVLIPNYFYHRSWRPGRHALAIRRFIQMYGRMVIRLSWPMIRTTIENRETVKKVQPCVYVLNHFSFADVFFCGYLPAHATVIAIRSWPFKIPILNIFMGIAKYMDVEKMAQDETLRNAAEELTNGNSILFFSEGHRSRNGNLFPLGKGAFRIAADNNVPIVPVTLEGTEYLGGYKSRLLKPCQVKMRFFPPIFATDNSFANVNALRQQVEALFLREVYDKRQPPSQNPEAA